MLLHRPSVMQVSDTYFTPLTWPPFSTHAWVPFLLNARDMGNSPSEETGWPIWEISSGFFGLIENSETVLEPGLTAASTLPAAEAFTVPWEKVPSGPSGSLTPCEPNPLVATALS